ncbi:hypothetical protein ACYZTM_19605 [Pseudomonas sp. MDT2-39-1]|uniref:hypothetical protein n=1 Tax=Pseudomonas sp. BGI-2 TaxID=2528211 RepID=UPI0010341699|nr:hypothetical protein [Pseudomonas sp. BGI-2]TBN34959.1 hypothetical protein EYC95_26405 [Pseudomonas sp. BGI-2]
MMSADLDELMLVSFLCPELVWSASSTRPVIVASDETVLRLYWMPVPLRQDPFRAELFVCELNGREKVMMAK